MEIHRFAASCKSFIIIFNKTMKIILRAVREGNKIRIYQTAENCAIYEVDTVVEMRKVLKERSDDFRNQFGKKAVIEIVEMPNL